MNIDATLAETIRVIREASGLAQLDLDILTKGQEKEFRISQGYLSNIERKHQVPSIFKLLSLARLCEVPLSRFLKPIGATDAEICGHVFSEEEKSFIAMMKTDPETKRLHQALQAALHNAGPEDMAFLRRALEFVMTGLQHARPEVEKPKARPKRSEAQGDRKIDFPDNVIPFTAISRDHDAPREVLVEDVRYFESVPAGNPFAVEPDGHMTVPVLAHLVQNKGERFYVLRIAGDSMEPKILDRDLVLVDCKRQAKNGDIVVALLGTESTVKQLIKRKGTVVLHPLNPRHRDIELGKDKPLIIQGVVTDIVRRTLD